MSIALASSPQMPDWVMTTLQNGTIQYAKNVNTDSNGSWSGALPVTGLAVQVQNRTAGEFANSVSVVGTTATVTFRKFKSAGLGITLGTLLTVSAFEDVSGVVNFDIIAVKQT